MNQREKLVKVDFRRKNIWQMIWQCLKCYRWFIYKTIVANTKLKLSVPKQVNNQVRGREQGYFRGYHRFCGI